MRSTHRRVPSNLSSSDARLVWSRSAVNETAKAELTWKSCQRPPDVLLNRSYIPLIQFRESKVLIKVQGVSVLLTLKQAGPTSIRCQTRLAYQTSLRIWLLTNPSFWPKRFRASRSRRLTASSICDKYLSRRPSSK